MAILGCYGEDIDFLSPASLAVQTSGMRTGYARCAICCPTGTKTLQFPGGAVTSAWLSWIGTFNSNDVNRRWIGLVNSAMRTKMPEVTQEIQTTDTNSALHRSAMWQFSPH